MPPRQCRKCLKEKTENDFYQDRWRPDGLMQSCKECSKTRSKKWKEENKKRYRTSQKGWYEKNRDSERIRNEAWKRANPEAVAAIRSARRAREASGRFTGADVKRLFNLQRGSCAICTGKLGKFHVDHVVPLAGGGTNDRSNIQILCPSCNVRKGTKHPVEYMQSLGRLC